MLKRLINLSVSFVVSIADWLSDKVNRLLGRPRRSTCVVLAYHSVPSKQRAQFARQMDVLTQRAKPVRADIESLPNDGGHYAAMTFDDGLQNILANALPELQARNIPATLFIVTSALGGNPSWEHFSGDDPAQERAMTEQQLQELPGDLISVGSHTMTHPVLPRIDDDQLRNELAGSRSRLETILNRDVKLFSFPYGAFDQRVTEACRAARYNRVFTALPVLAFAQPGEFVTGRAGAAPTDWPIEFRLKLVGAYRWLPYAYALKRKIFSALRGGGTQPLPLKADHKRVA